MLLILGPTFYILDLLTQSFGNYIAEFIQMSSRLSPENDGERSWINAWTLFYWAFWISWAPFVGTFIARISRGRTRSEEHTSELQSRGQLVCRLLLEKKK